MATLYRPIKAGKTDVSVILTILDSTTGLRKTDVAYNSAGIALSYRREGATTTAITEATLANAGSAHSDGGFVHIGDGEYRLDLPDAACAAGVDGVLVHGAVTGGVIQAIYIPLVIIDFSATVTSIPELGIIDIGTLQSADASGAVIRSGATFANDLIIGSMFVATSGTGYGQSRIVYDNALTGDAIYVSPNWVTNPDNTTNYVLLASPPAPTNSAVLPATNVAAIGGDTQSATDLKDFADTGYNPATHKVAGVVLTDTVTTYTGNTPQTGDSYARIGATGSGLTSLASQTSVNTIDDFLDTEIAAIKAVTDNLPNSGTLSSLATAAAVTALQTTLNTSRYIKNTSSQKVYFVMVLSSDHVSAATGITVTAQRSLDGAAFGSATGTVTEIGNGLYFLSTSAADINADDVVFRFTGTACDPVQIHIPTAS